MNESKLNLEPEQQALALTDEQRELFNPEFTVEANLVKYSAVFPPHNPSTNFYTTKHVDAVPASLGGGVIVTSLSTSTSPGMMNGKVISDRVPGDFEKKVFYAIVSLWAKAGKPEDGIVQFSMGNLLEQLGLSRGGKIYRLIKEAISRIARSTIRIDGSYVSAPEFKRETREFSLFVDYQESESRRGRKSTSGGVENDFYKVTLNTAIVSNMIHDYSVKINVKDYTASQSKYYRRLVDIIEFEFQRGTRVGKEKIDFLFLKLAKNLPLEEGGANNVSTALKRLSTSLKELKEMGGYDFEIRKIGDNAIFTVYSKTFSQQIKQAKSFDEQIEDYLKTQEKLFGEPLYKVISDSEKTILDVLRADDTAVEFEGRTYPRSIHVLDVFVFQYFVKPNKSRLKAWNALNQERGSILRITRSVLNDSIKLKYPDGYKSYDERLKEHEATIVKNHLVAVELKKSNDTASEAEKQAQALYEELNHLGTEHYVKRIKAEFPKLSDEVVRSPKLMVDTIMEDILNGAIDRSHFKAIKPQQSLLK